ncbi:hypothetical protein POM88_023566 [Heracleum sosnowskyi]|uniref:Transposase-associated domain-containing protein n=1 Tax=Heracleum sosnowskyi TaxID=360622 RepID=A0AAD8MUK3_9APIA|nr:hypothetical protein POM88_023566 [Heracleum sosnowskyi]
MDRHTWMYKISRATQEYIDGVEKFIQCAEENLKKKKEHGKEDRITCPCHDYYNLKKYSSVATIREHLFRRGFMAGYTKWIWHGEGIHSEKTRTSDGNRRSNEDNYLASVDPVGIPRSRHEGRLEGQGTSLFVDRGCPNAWSWKRSFCSRESGYMILFLGVALLPTSHPRNAGGTR